MGMFNKKLLVAKQPEIVLEEKKRRFSRVFPKVDEFPYRDNSDSGYDPDMNFDACRESCDTNL